MSKQKKGSKPDVGSTSNATQGPGAGDSSLTIQDELGNQESVDRILDEEGGGPLALDEREEEEEVSEEGEDKENENGTAPSDGGGGGDEPNQEETEQDGGGGGDGGGEEGQELTEGEGEGEGEGEAGAAQEVDGGGGGGGGGEGPVVGGGGGGAPLVATAQPALGVAPIDYSGGELDEQQSLAVGEQTGMTPEQHNASIQAGLSGVQAMIQGMQAEVVARAEQLASTVASEMAAEAGNMGGETSAAQGSISAAYSAARSQVSEAANAARAQIETDATSGRATLDASFETQLGLMSEQYLAAQESVNAQHATWLGPFDTMAQTAATDFQATADAKANSLAGRRAAIIGVHRGSGNALERYKGEKRMDVAGQAVDAAVDRFKNEAPQKANEAVNAQDFGAVIQGFLDPLQLQVEELGNHGAEAVQAAYDTANLQFDEEHPNAVASVDQAEAEALAELDEDEAAANAELQGGGGQLDADIQGESDSATALFTDTAAAFADAYAARVEEIRAGLPDGVFMTQDQVDAYISEHTAELQAFHAENLAELDGLYGAAIGGLDQMISDDYSHVSELVAANQEEAQRIADEKCGYMEEASLQFGQSMLDIGSAVDVAMADYVAPVQADMSAYIAECDAALATKLTETTEILSGLNVAYGTELDTEIAAFEANIDVSSAATNVESELRDMCKNAYSAMRGWGTDESKLYNALRKVTTSTHGAAAKVMWGMQYPGSDSLVQWLYDDLSGSELSIAENYLAGNTALAAQMELEENMCWYGDDEAQIETILRDLSPEDMTAMQNLPGWESTRAELQDNLDGTDLDVTESLLVGNVARADAYRLRDQINSARRKGDDDALHSALAGIDSNQLASVQAEFYNINNGVTASQTDVAPVDPAVASAALVTAVTEPVEVQQYDPNTGEVYTITREITGANADLATALATEGNDSMAADVARFEVERTRNGGPTEANMETALYMSAELQQQLRSDDAAVRAQAEAMRDARAAAFRQQWQDQYGAESGFANLDAAMDAEYANSDNSAVEQRVHDNMLDAGTNSAEVVSDLTFLSIDGAGTDEDRLKRSYEGMRPDEVQETRELYADAHGNGVTDALDRDLGVNEHSGFGSEVSGDDRRDMEGLLLGDEQYMNDEQRLALVNHELKWSVGEESTGFGRAIMGDSDEDTNLRIHADNLQALLNVVASTSPTGSAYNADGSFAGTPAQYEDYRRLCAFVGINAAHYRERQDSIASLLTTIAAILIAAAVTFATGGAAGPAAAMWIAALTGASKIILNAAVLGGRYGWEQMVQDGAITAVEVATAGIGARLNAGGGIFRQAEGVVNARTIVGQGIVGFGTGFVNSASSAAINEQPDWALAGVSGGLSSGISAGVGERLGGMKLGEGRSALQQAFIAGGENAAGDALGSSTALMFDAATGRFTGDFDDAFLQVAQSTAQSFVGGALNKAAGDWGAAHGMGPNLQQNAPTEEMGSEISDQDVIEAAGMTEADILRAANEGLGEVGEPDMSAAPPDQETETGLVAYMDDDGNKAVDIDGGTAIETPDGTVIVELDDGSIAVDGGEVDSGVMSDGTEVIRDGDDAAIRHPDGTVESTLDGEGVAPVLVHGEDVDGNVHVNDVDADTDDSQAYQEHLLDMALADLDEAGYSDAVAMARDMDPDQAMEFAASVLRQARGSDGRIETSGDGPVTESVRQLNDMPDADLKQALVDAHGLGETLADRIIAERQNGPFASAEDLQNRVSGIGPVRAALVEAALSGRTELHNHQGGVFTTDDVVAALAHNAPDDMSPQQYLHEVLSGLDLPASALAVLESAPPNAGQEWYDAQLTAMLSAGTVPFDDCYKVRRALFADQPSDAISNTRIMLERLKSQGIDYVELQGGMSDQVPPSVLARMCEEVGIEVRFLGAIRSRNTLGSEGDDGTALAKTQNAIDQMFNPENGGFVVGVDYLGQEQAFTSQGQDHFVESCLYMQQQLVANGQESGVMRVHVGEGYFAAADTPELRATAIQEAHDNVDSIIEAIQQFQSQSTGDADVQIRVGHVTHATEDQIAQLASLGVHVEVNLGSNLATGSIESLDQHPLLAMLYHDVDLSINTDAGGVMSTDLDREFIHAGNIIEAFQNGDTSLVIGGNEVTFDELPADVQARFSVESLEQRAQEHRRQPRD